MPTDINPYAPFQVEVQNVEVAEAPAVPVAPEVPAEVLEQTAPEGSIDTVLEWVGDDADRAQIALDAEKGGAKRKTLIAKLEDVIN